MLCTVWQNFELKAFCNVVYSSCGDYRRFPGVWHHRCTTSCSSSLTGERAVLGIDVAPSSPKLGLAELKMVADITQKLIMQGVHTACDSQALVLESVG